MWENVSAIRCIHGQDDIQCLIDTVRSKQNYFVMKQAVDFTAGAVLGVVLSPLCVAIGVVIAIQDGKKPIFSQERIGRYGKPFAMYKFRTMRTGGSPLTGKNDPRVTKFGKTLRKYRLDELPQLFNIIKGDISLIGSRPEHASFVQQYNTKMRATLLVPVGVTSQASITFKNEADFLDIAEPEIFYKECILPIKAQLNLEYIYKCSLAEDIKLLIKTVFCVCKG